MTDIPQPIESIRGKVASALIATALISAVLVAAVGVRLIGQASDEVAVAELRRQASSIAQETAFLRREPAQAIRFLSRALGSSGAALYQVQDDGGLLLVGGEATVPLTAAEARALAGGRQVSGHKEVLGSDVVFVGQPIPQRTGLVLVLGRQAGLEATNLPVARRLLFAALIAVGVAAIVAFFLSNRITDPLRQLASAAQSVARGRFETRVPVHSEDEIGVVAGSFNEMAERLGESDRRQREFFLSISHELRTPLTAIQGYAEAVEDGTAVGDGARNAGRVIAEEARRLTRLVSDLLDLARIDAKRFQVEIEEVDVAAVLGSVSEKFGPLAEDVVIEVVAEDVKAKADPDRLVQVLSNLVENGLRYTPAGRTVVLGANAAGPLVQITVTDGGVGIDEADIPHAFERQYLWRKYRGVRDVGTGLGLAICKELVESMGGSVSAGNAPGSGARFTVTLSAA